MEPFDWRSIHPKLRMRNNVYRRLVDIGASAKKLEAGRREEIAKH
jgi:hypothetical protein